MFGYTECRILGPCMDVISRSDALLHGLKFYFTGLPCSRGHIAQRRANSRGCIACESENNHKQFAIDARKRYAGKNRESNRERASRWYAENKDRKSVVAKRWREANKDAVKEGTKRRYERNKRAYFMRSKMRKIRVSRATPRWADLDIIKNFYIEAEYLQMEIDHIVPLNSPLVCGLHVENNLQALSRSENAAKGNRHWPDMP